MAAKDDIRESLTTRRANITPEQAGTASTPKSRLACGAPLPRSGPAPPSSGSRPDADAAYLRNGRFDVLAANDLGRAP